MSRFDEDMVPRDKRSRRRIRKILKIESSISYHLYEFIALWLDYYFRIAYPLLFCLYMIYMGVKLQDNQVLMALTITAEVLFLVGLIVWIGVAWYFKLGKRIKALLGNNK